MGSSITVPLSVPTSERPVFIQNYKIITRDSGNLFLFSGDQKIEHLNKDFYGDGIAEADATPEHLFNIANVARIGAFATQLGLIDRYGSHYPDIPYIVKLNSKTNLVKTDQAEPLSRALCTIDEVIRFKKTSGLNIVGVGYTAYLGSEHEAQMLSECARMFFEAHTYGLMTILWAYPRGKAVPDERDADIISGAAGVAACLGADFAKINPPKAVASAESAELLVPACMAAGNTKLICSGGKSISPEEFLQGLYDQIHIGGTHGCAVGRNIHQKSLPVAIALCNAIAAIVNDRRSIDEALELLD